MNSFNLLGGIQIFRPLGWKPRVSVGHNYYYDESTLVNIQSYEPSISDCP